MSDVSVQPLRTFWHGELKTKRSKAFDVETGAAYELKALGLVEIKGDTAKAAPDFVESVEPAVEPIAVPAPKKKAKPNADDKDS